MKSQAYFSDDDIEEAFDEFESDMENIDSSVLCYLIFEYQLIQALFFRLFEENDYDMDEFCELKEDLSKRYEKFLRERELIIDKVYSYEEIMGSLRNKDENH